MAYYIRVSSEPEDYIQHTQWYAYENGNLMCRAVSLDPEEGYHWATLNADSDSGVIWIEHYDKSLPFTYVDSITKGHKYTFVSQKEFETVWETARYHRPRASWSSGYSGFDKEMTYCVKKVNSTRTLLFFYEKSRFDRAIIITGDSYQFGDADSTLIREELAGEPPIMHSPLIIHRFTYRGRPVINNDLIPPGVYIDAINEGEPWEFMSRRSFNRLWKKLQS